MPGHVQHARLETRTSRARLKRGRQPHWQALVPGKVHLGYRVRKGEPQGRWVLRRYVGSKYRVGGLGAADDTRAANGQDVLSFEQAEAKARALVEAPGGGKIVRLTVRQAMDAYIAAKTAAGQPTGDVQSRGTAHILPTLGDVVVADLTSEQLRNWLATMAAAPAQKRPKQGKVQFKPAPEGDEAVRRRRASANRVLNMLKGMLNFAYDEGHIPHRDAWGRKLKPFAGVDQPRVRYLQIAEGKRLINACDPEFQPLARAALETGARYSELARLEVSDFNIDVGAVAIRKSKSSKARHVILTDDGVRFFRQHCAGRAGHELMFRHDDGSGWKAAEQGRPMTAAVKAARITPPISFHGLRHTWASHAVMGGVPLMVVAKNLGHADTRTVEKVYGHLSPGYIVDAIRAGAPRYGIKPGKRVVVPLR